LEVIDTALAKVASKMRSTQQELNREEAALEGYAGELKQMEYIAAMEKDVVAVEKAAQKLKDVQTKEQGLRGILINRKQIEDATEHNAVLLGANTTVDELLEIDTVVNSLLSDKTTILFILDKIGSTQNKIDSTVVVNAEGDVKKYIELLGKADAKDAEAEKLEKLIMQIKQKQIDMDAFTARLDKLEAEFHELMPDMCPLCGGIYKVKYAKRSK
jgi:hypothetical protein